MRSFSKISSHKKVTNKDPDYKGSMYNLEIDWDNGETSWEPLKTIFRDDPMSVYAHATDNDLLQTDGWKKIGRMKRNVKFMKRMINASKARKHDVRYKFGIRIPRNVKEAHRRDSKNGNTKWAESIKRKMDQIMSFSTCHSIGRDAHTRRGLDHPLS
jgi:hypothetical protein